MQPRDKLLGLQAARFYAAMAIVLYHLVKLAHLELPEWLGFVDPYFAMGVPLFYVLSAFALFIGYAGKLNDREQIKAFYVRRFTRIAPLFYFVMLAYIPFLWLLNGTTAPISKFVTSALFIFNVVPQHAQGFVWASWSIGVEMTFYAILPLLALFITDTLRAVFFLFVSIALAAFWHDAFRDAPETLKGLGSYSLVNYLYYFAFGLLGYFVWRSEISKRLSGTLIIAASAAMMVGAIAFASPLIHFYGRVFGYWAADTTARATWGFILMLFVVGIAHAPIKLLVSRATCYFGDASFSLYLWHPVIIGSLIRWGGYKAIQARLGDGLPGVLACAVVTLIILLPIARASFDWIERPGMRLSRIILSRETVTKRPVENIRASV